MANSYFYNPYYNGGLGSSAASGQLELPTIENILKDNYESLKSAMLQ